MNPKPTLAQLEKKALSFVGRRKASTKKKGGGRRRAKPVYLNGEVYDSTTEFHRYLQLQQKVNKGEISDLQKQVTYSLDVEGEHICDYIADFVYTENGQTIVEDTKSLYTSNNPVFRIKRKLMLALHKVRVKVVILKRRGMGRKSALGKRKKKR